MTTATGIPSAATRVLYAVACAAPPALHIRTLIKEAQDRQWDTCLILTPTAARWLDADLEDLERLTGHPVRSAYKLPGEPDVLPPPDAVLVAPASSNTINKWALGISDNLALGLITEGIGKGLPLVAIPYLNQAQATHPAFPRSIEVLRGAGVNVLIGPDGWEPHQPGGNKPDQFPWHLGLHALK
ncbi:MAG: flavoprotein [Actinomycetia bacterium]|nr:flavoprotein [Actinomycetes bacterium]